MKINEDTVIDLYLGTDRIMQLNRAIDGETQILYEATPALCTVSVTCPHGYVTLVPAAEDNAYESGTEVEAQWSPNDTGVFTNFIVDGQTISDTLKAYKFTITKNTTIEVATMPCDSRFKLMTLSGMPSLVALARRDSISATPAWQDASSWSTSGVCTMLNDILFVHPLVPYGTSLNVKVTTASPSSKTKWSSQVAWDDPNLLDLSTISFPAATSFTAGEKSYTIQQRWYIFLLGETMTGRYSDALARIKKV